MHARPPGLSSNEARFDRMPRLLAEPGHFRCVARDAPHKLDRPRADRRRNRSASWETGCHAVSGIIFRGCQQDEKTRPQSSAATWFQRAGRGGASAAARHHGIGGCPIGICSEPRAGPIDRRCFPRAVPGRPPRAARPLSGSRPLRVVGPPAGGRRGFPELRTSIESERRRLPRLVS